MNISKYYACGFKAYESYVSTKSLRSWFYLLLQSTSENMLKSLKIWEEIISSNEFYRCSSDCGKMIKVFALLEMFLNWKVSNFNWVYSGI
jgi:hypothetical protein